MANIIIDAHKNQRRNVQQYVFDAYNLNDSIHVL